MRVFITGSAGFIGMHLTSEFIKQGHEVVSLDSLAPSYGGDLALRRCEFLFEHYGHKLIKADLNSLSESELLNTIGDSELLIHLAAWPGVRHGQNNPTKYSLNNIVGFSRVLAAVHKLELPKLFFASSSSVYGDLSIRCSVQESHATGTNLKSHYAVTKWINELEARSFANIGHTKITALRFFTAYGPWGRPDMAYWLFLEKLLQKQPVTLYGKNGGIRNFTYIDDLVDIVYKLTKIEVKDNFHAFNIACGEPIETLELLMSLKEVIGVKKMKILHLDRPSVDVEKTWANLDNLNSLITLPNTTPILSGLVSFLDWHQKFYEYKV